MALQNAQLITHGQIFVDGGQLESLPVTRDAEAIIKSNYSLNAFNFSERGNCLIQYSALQASDLSLQSFVAIR